MSSYRTTFLEFIDFLPRDFIMDRFGQLLFNVTVCAHVWPFSTFKRRVKRTLLGGILPQHLRLLTPALLFLSEHSDEPNEELFHNMFFEILFDMEVNEFQAARLFIHWIDTAFYDHIQQYVEFAAYDDLDQMAFLTDLYPWTLRLRMRELQSH